MLLDVAAPLVLFSGTHTGVTSAQDVAHESTSNAMRSGVSTGG